MPTETDQSGTLEPTPTAGSTEFSGPLFVSACVVLPVIWGVIVHLVFTWLRKKYDSDEQGAPSWPDYQI